MGSEVFGKFRPDRADRVQHGAAVLKDEGRLLADRLRLRFLPFKKDVSACHLSLPWQDMADSAEDGRLPRAGFPDDGKNFPFVHGKGYPVDDGISFAV